jgi:DNA invertase Pin-like site-specific DNA recombinase
MNKSQCNKGLTIKLARILEREQISEATMARLAAIKASGKRLGRPLGKRDGKPRRKSGYYQRYANKGGSK